MEKMAIVRLPLHTKYFPCDAFTLHSNPLVISADTVKLLLTGRVHGTDAVNPFRFHGKSLCNRGLP